MSSYNLVTQGENVHLTFVSTASAVVAAAMTVLDANMAVRPLKPSERLIIDDLQGSISVGTATVIALTSTGATAPSSTNLIASFNTAIGLDVDAKEGISLPVGILPAVLPEGTGSTGVIRIAGNGRIVEGSTTAAISAPMVGSLGRPNWREALTPNGNF